MTETVVEPVGTIESGVISSEYEVLVPTVRFYVDGYVNDDMARSLADEMYAADAEDDQATWEIVINSQGGEMFAGSAIYTDVLSYAVRGGGSHWVLTRVRGICGSVATLVLQAGDVRLGGVMDTLLLHEPAMTCTDLPLHEIRDNLRKAEDWLERYVGVHVERSKVDRDFIYRRIRGRDWTISIPEAVEYGLVDLIDGSV